MTTPAPRRRRGSHRTGRSMVAALMPSLLAVLAVAALITSLAVWRAGEADQPQAAASTRSPSHPTREAISEAASSSTPSHSATTTHTSTTAPSSTTPAPRESAGDFDVEVVVLNQTSRAGLAGVVADRLRAKGWTVGVVGNFHGVVPATTVYYPPGQQDAARVAADDLPVAPRIMPRFSNLSTTRLTVVVTDSYPG
ncbi:MAG TPA: LytR C-terminal domain-containing protein [Actinomycetes bacterium]